MRKLTSILLAMFAMGLTAIIICKGQNTPDNEVNMQHQLNQKLLPPGWDPVLAEDLGMQRLIRVTAPHAKGAHDAEFARLGGFEFQNNPKHIDRTTPTPLGNCIVKKRPALWDSTQNIPQITELPVLKGVEFYIIKRYQPDTDGYRFLHGVALAWYKGKLYSSFGHNKGSENTDTEEARFNTTADGGKTWSTVATIDRGNEPGIGVSHGVFLLFKGLLWAFHGAYTGTMQNVHTRAYLLDDDMGKWLSKGTVIDGGFWPLGEPVHMSDGNWIMAGLRVGGGNPAAVAISHGDDFTKWDLVVIPLANDLGDVWGESAIMVESNRVTNIARWGKEPQALVAVSEDYGRTWTSSQPSNLPMATSKPCAGMLSTGQRFLICSTSADGGKQRSPLTIAVSKPGEMQFSKIFVIRHAEFPGDSGESNPKAALSYPCAIEHDGKLYVGYSNSGGGIGRVGTGRELWNNNSAEMAVIPISSLKISERY